MALRSDVYGGHAVADSEEEEEEAVPVRAEAAEAKKASDEAKDKAQRDREAEQAAAAGLLEAKKKEAAEKKAESVLRLYPILQPAFKFYAWTSLQLLLAVLLTALPAERGKHITALLLVWTVQLAVLEAHEAYANRPLWAADPLNMYVHARAPLSAHPRSVPWY